MKADVAAVLAAEMNPGPGEMLQVSGRGQVTGDDVLHRGLEVGKRGEEFLHSFPVGGRPARLLTERPVFDEVRGFQLVDEVQVPIRGHRFGAPPRDSLVFFDGCRVQLVYAPLSLTNRGAPGVAPSCYHTSCRLYRRTDAMIR